MTEKKTVGKASLELSQQNHAPVSPIEYERAMHEEYEQAIHECIDNHKPLIDGDFYVVVLRKRERLMANVYRNYFLARRSCPTPTYDQVVYRFHRKEDAIEFLWVIPDEETAHMYKRHALEVVSEEKQLLQFVLDFYDGTLDTVAKKLNREDKYGRPTTDNGAIT